MTFGGHRLDLGARQLFRGRTEVHLSPKAFELLRLLVEHRSRALSKAELHEHLWPSTFVTEANLASIVAELRRALGDESRTPTFIRTVHGFGYAFACPVADDVEVAPARRACWIVWRGREFALRDGDNIIGRDSAAALPLDYPSVSRRHARIVVGPETVTIEDLGSKNGTLVRRKRIKAAIEIHDLDDVQIGSVRVTIRILRGGEATETIA